MLRNAAIMSHEGNQKRPGLCINNATDGQRSLMLSDFMVWFLDIPKRFEYFRGSFTLTDKCHGGLCLRELDRAVLN